MKVGFTGTQHGMTETQLRTLTSILREFAITDPEFHHGDCTGADAEADQLARPLGYRVVVHPPADPKRRAYCAQPGDEVWPEAPYLIRNREMVRAVEVLLVAPKTLEQELRSGTWATYRYARSLGKAIWLLSPV